MIKIWHISDSHCLHADLKVPEVDMVIHSGDFANSRNSAINSNEVMEFLDWFVSLKIKHKVLVAGNHDISIENRMIHPNFILDAGITYLENNSVTIDGLKIWGSPITPSFGKGWAWNIARHKTNLVWGLIPQDADIIITHGPPRGILDINQEMELCGCKSLMRKVKAVSPMLHLFGHVHNNETVINSGIRKINNLNTIFSNGSVVRDGKTMIINNGNVITL